MTLKKQIVKFILANLKDNRPKIKSTKTLKSSKSEREYKPYKNQSYNL